MTFSFDLVGERWVPCVTHQGATEELSLTDALLQAHTYRELGGESPLVTAALYRLMLAILHRVFGPEDRDAWCDLWARGRLEPTPLLEYLSRWRHRFDLFDGERPFYQGDHPTIPCNPIGNLLHELSRDDTLYDHRTATGIGLAPAQAARHVVCAQAFGRWMTKGPYGQLPFGTCARGIVFYAKGDSLFEDLVLNLIRYPSRDDVMPCDHANDAPCWEMEDPFVPARSVAFGYLDYMTWLSRRILLLPETENGQVIVYRAKIAPGLRMTDEMRNPAMQHKDCRKRGWKSWVPFTEKRALWRDSASIMQVPHEAYDARDSHPPAIIEWLASLVGETQALTAGQTMRLAGMGIAGDLNQYRVHFHRREELPLPLAYLQKQDLVSHLQQAIGEAEDAGRQLFGALSTLAVQMLFHKQEQRLSGPAKIERNNLIASWGVERLYWADLELPFHSLITDLPHDDQPARRAWALTVRNAAWRALDAAIAAVGEDPPALKAAVLARGQLGGGLHKVLQHWFPREPEEV